MRLRDSKGRFCERIGCNKTFYYLNSVALAREAKNAFGREFYNRNVGDSQYELYWGGGNLPQLIEDDMVKYKYPISTHSLIQYMVKHRGYPIGWYLVEGNYE